MAVSFSRTLRALKAERSRGRYLEALGAVLLLAWIAWFLLGQVAVYEVTDHARLEVRNAAHPVAAPVAGQVIETRLALGQTVKAGQILVLLDSRVEQRALEEKQTRRQALAAKLKAVGKEIQAEDEALRAELQAGKAALEESQAQIQKAEAESRFADSQLEMITQLRTRSSSSDLELRRARAEAEMSRVAVRTATLAVKRLEHERVVREDDRKTRLAKLRRDAVDLEEEAKVEEAAIRRLEHDIELRSIRAPVAGQIGEVVELPVGSAVRAADKLGAIVPRGEPRAVALFPSTVVGRLHPGQPARLRLAGFPWTQYGTMPATVAEVGNEASEGRVRVELRLESVVSSSIPLEHGLPGSAEVAVERISPALLVLRAAGQFLGTKRPPPASASEPIEP